MTLRGKLLATLLALLAVAVITVDITTSSALRSFLYQKLDQQLVQAVQPAERTLLGAASGIDYSHQPPFVPVGSYEEYITQNGPTIVAAVVSQPSEAGPPPILTRSKNGVTSLVIRTGVPSTVGAQHSSTLTYRVLATALAARNSFIVVAIPLTSVVGTLHQLLIVEILVSLGVLLLVTSLGGALLRLGLKPLKAMTDTAGAIADGDLTKRVETDLQDDEVGRLAKALNKMLTRIQDAVENSKSSEDRLRRFVADASHELRTPLTSIRGYAELYSRGAISEPSQISRAMERIESESVRMSALVEDLLALARLDQTKTIEFQPVDIAILARDAFDDASAVEPSRPMRLSGATTAVVSGDPYRLTQVIVNLLSNARNHTPSSAQVEVRIEKFTGNPSYPNGVPIAFATQAKGTTTSEFNGRGEAKGWVRLLVRDAGPGIEPDDLKMVFERFYRTDASRSRSQGGSGLGLSLVAAITEVHGGVSWVASSGSQKGTMFGIDLPVLHEEPDRPMDLKDSGGEVDLESSPVEQTADHPVEAYHEVEKGTDIDQGSDPS